jgi:3-dehydroquinate synthase
MQAIRVSLGSRSYSVAFASSDGFAGFLRDCGVGRHGLFFIADSNTAGHAQMLAQVASLAGYRVGSTTVPAGEGSKALTFYAQLLDALAAFGAERKTAVVAVGGGVVGDLSGFAAATYNRGLPFLQVPTTLLAMVDSSVGGKVGINHPQGKNLIGAFHQPAGVYIDVSFLKTLPEREYRSGMGEVVKYGVIQDAEFFAWLEAHLPAILQRDEAALQHMVSRSCRLKADVVEQDEREETGLRMILNYGHTFAHAFETVGGYGTWLHGEAVAAGMVCACHLAEKLGLISGELTKRQNALLLGLKLPIAPDPTWEMTALCAVMRKDKKAEAGTLRFVLPVRLGAVEVFGNIAEADAVAAMQCAIAGAVAIHSSSVA